MLPVRLARASALRSSLAASRRLPVIQRRTFLPEQYTDQKVLDSKFPERQELSEEEDPEMVR